MADYFRWSATLFSSRGCPYGCIFCHNIFGKKFRARSSENVLSEIKFLYGEYGIKDFEFVDDIFNCGRARTMEILKGIRDGFNDVGIAFPNGLRADLLDEETIILLKEARCWHVSVAVESASERMQKNIHKNLNLSKVRNAIDLLKKHGIHSRGFFMIGFPGETMEEIKQTMNFYLDAPLNHSVIFIAAPYNKTEMRENVSAGKLKRFNGYQGDDDYPPDYVSAGDIPYERLENIRTSYYKKGILRLRNWRLWFSAVKGLVRGRAWHRIFVLLMLVAGVGGRLVSKEKIDSRINELDRFRRAILE